MTIKNISLLANQLLEKHGFKSSPIKPSRLAEIMGITVFEKDFTDDVSGALTFKDDKPIILFNKNHSINRQRFTIAHEIGHYILKHGRDGLFIDKQKHFILRNADSATGEKRQEVEANAFAAALLMPEKMVIKEFNKLVNKNGLDLYEEEDNEDIPFIKDLAKKFEVSQKAMTFRIANLRLLS